MRKLEFVIGRTSFSLKLFLKYNSQLKCIAARRIIFLSTIYVYIFLYASRNLLFLPFTCSRSDVDRKAREPRVSICRGRLRVACIDQTERTFSPVRPIEPDRSANPKYDCEMFVSILISWLQFLYRILIKIFQFCKPNPRAQAYLNFSSFSFLSFSKKENNAFDRDNANLKKHIIQSNK